LSVFLMFLFISKLLLSNWVSKSALTKMILNYISYAYHKLKQCRIIRYISSL